MCLSDAVVQRAHAYTEHDKINVGTSGLKLGALVSTTTSPERFTSSSKET